MGYRKHTGAHAAPQVRDVKFFVDQALEHERSDTKFTGEEHHGQFLDLQVAYNSWLNLKKLQEVRKKKFYEEQVTRLRKRMPDADVAQIEEAAKDVPFEQIDYISWLSQFDRFHEYPRHVKFAVPEYLKYLEDLHGYLEGTFERFHPLSDHAALKQKIEEEFDDRWEKNQCPGWTVPTHKDPLFCLPSYRVFANESTLQSHQKGKQYKKKLAALQKLPLADQQKALEETRAEDKKISRFETLIGKCKDFLQDTADATVEHLQKKQSRTVEELAAAQEEMENWDEDEELEEEEEETGDVVDKPVYNPLNLPLGWDGKPIPFWLYKLHGLGTEYKCEVCGNYSYWGRRAFDRHFQEWRHAYGMRALKIPNTTHFKDVTKIEDAVRLYEKLKRESGQATFDFEREMECEDANGNVMSYRAYNDLKRQGLV